MTCCRISRRTGRNTASTATSSTSALMSRSLKLSEIRVRPDGVDMTTSLRCRGPLDRFAQPSVGSVEPLAGMLGVCFAAVHHDRQLHVAVGAAEQIERVLARKA